MELYTLCGCYLAADQGFYDVCVYVLVSANALEGLRQFQTHCARSSLWFGVDVYACVVALDHDM